MAPRWGHDEPAVSGAGGMAYGPGEIDGLPSIIEFDAASLVLRTYNRMNSGTVRGDQALAEKFLNLFFAI